MSPRPAVPAEAEAEAPEQLPAADIPARLKDGSMPSDGGWPAAKVEVFQRWADTGMQP
jgi:hypothetical protein